MWSAVVVSSDVFQSYSVMKYSIACYHETDIYPVSNIHIYYRTARTGCLESEIPTTGPPSRSGWRRGQRPRRRSTFISSLVVCHLLCVFCYVCAPLLLHQNHANPVHFHSLQFNSRTMHIIIIMITITITITISYTNAQSQQDSLLDEMEFDLEALINGTNESPDKDKENQKSPNKASTSPVKEQASNNTNTGNGDMGLLSSPAKPTFSAASNTNKSPSPTQPAPRYSPVFNPAGEDEFGTGGLGAQTSYKPSGASAANYGGGNGFRSVADQQANRPGSPAQSGSSTYVHDGAPKNTNTYSTGGAGVGTNTGANAPTFSTSSSVGAGAGGYGSAVAAPLQNRGGRDRAHLGVSGAGGGYEDSLGALSSQVGGSSSGAGGYGSKPQPSSYGNGSSYGGGGGSSSGYQPSAIGGSGAAGGYGASDSGGASGGSRYTLQARYQPTTSTIPVGGDSGSGGSVGGGGYGGGGTSGGSGGALATAAKTGSNRFSRLASFGMGMAGGGGGAPSG